MSTASVTSDQGILDQLRRRPQNVAQLASATQVTATAVRQRLTRLMAQGLIERMATPVGRGRPSHSYSLTAAGRQHAGVNYDDLAQALWAEIRAIDNPQVQRGLLKRISQRLAGMYDEQVNGAQPVERMRALSRMFAERNIPFEVEMQQELPVLTALACPYPHSPNRIGVCVRWSGCCSRSWWVRTCG